MCLLLAVKVKKDYCSKVTIKELNQEFGDRIISLMINFIPPSHRPKVLIRGDNNNKYTAAVFIKESWQIGEETRNSRGKKYNLVIR